MSILVVVCLWVITLAGCLSNEPSEELVIKAAKKGILRPAPGSTLFRQNLLSVERVAILKRHKSYSSSFEDPGDTTINYPLTVSITFSDGTVEELDFTLFQRKRDDSWWCEQNGLPQVVYRYSRVKIE